MGIELLSSRLCSPTIAQIAEDGQVQHMTKTYHCKSICAEPNEALLCGAPHDQKGLAVLGGGSGSLIFTQEPFSTCSSVGLSNSAVYDVVWLDGETVAVGAAGGVYAYDVERGLVVMQQALRGSVRACVRVPHSFNMFCTGGRDGSVFLWDMRIARPIVSHQRGRRGVSVTSVCFPSDSALFATAETPGRALRLWDTRWTERGSFRAIGTVEMPSAVCDMQPMPHRGTVLGFFRNGTMGEYTRFFSDGIEHGKITRELDFGAKAAVLRLYDEVAIGNIDGTASALCFLPRGQTHVQTTSYEHGGDATNCCFVSSGTLLSFGLDGCISVHAKNL